MATSKSKKQQSAAGKPKGRGSSPSVTSPRFFNETPEEEIRRIYTMTPAEAAEIIRKSGILTPSGKLKRGYR